MKRGFYSSLSIAFILFVFITAWTPVTFAREGRPPGPHDPWMVWSLEPGVIAALALISASESFLEAALLLASAHLPVMIIEGIITAFCIVFLKKVRSGGMPF